MLNINNKEKGNSQPMDNVLNTISRGTTLEGKIVTKGDIRIEGLVVGTVHCEAKLVIGEHGRVEGSIESRNAYIAGTVKGTVVVKELLQLQEKGRIEGDIVTQKLSVQVGAVFTGNCQMGNTSGAAVNGGPAQNSLRNGHVLQGQSGQEGYKVNA